ncbi:hypothetical protein AB0G15_05330 [Streptosporangium sp. NPDC023825]|uniref:hypothetical protein n=1 Tax=Streptosporangium sp. NPDC023825 TaxID=3154909 RepID=UPI00341B72F0
MNNLSRSTIPAKDVKSVEYWGANSSRLAAQGKRGKTNGGDIELAPGSESTPTAIHELGHAVSAASKAPHRSQFSGLSLKGAEEGYADNYTYSNFRFPGYKGKSIPDSSDKIRDRSTRWNGVYRSSGKQEDFQKGYLAMRLPMERADQYQQGKLF